MNKLNNNFLYNISKANPDHSQIATNHKAVKKKQNTQLDEYIIKYIIKIPKINAEVILDKVN